MVKVILLHWMGYISLTKSDQVPVPSFIIPITISICPSICVIQILERLVFDLSDTHSRIHSALQPIHTRLIEIKRELQNLLRRPFHAFTLSEVTGLQDELREIDDARIDGKFFSLNQEIIPGNVEYEGTNIIDFLRPLSIFLLFHLLLPS